MFNFKKGDKILSPGGKYARITKVIDGRVHLKNNVDKPTTLEIDFLTRFLDDHSDYTYIPFTDALPEELFTI